MPDVLLRGDMRRHRETAEGLAEGAGWSLDSVVDPGWNEFDHLGVVTTLFGPGQAPPGRGRRADGP